MLGAIKNFVSEVVTELKKVSWSTRQEVIDATWIVLISTAMLGVFIASTDFLLAKILKVIIKY